jgi:hypothetical protein
VALRLNNPKIPTLIRNKENEENGDSEENNGKKKEENGKKKDNKRATNLVMIPKLEILDEVIKLKFSFFFFESNDLRI